MNDYNEQEFLTNLIYEIESAWLMGEDRPPYPNELAEDLIRHGVRAHKNDRSTCEHCGGESWHHTIECYTGVGS